MTAQDHSPAPVQREIKRLLLVAAEHGEADSYGGKRHVTRVTTALQLEVTSDPSNPSAAWGVAMHDISERGLAFWSKQDLPDRSLIHIREFSPDSPRTWIPARVKHSTAGIRGHLIGAEFDTADHSVPSLPQPR
ncbi:MAG: PilZ domain-containing protein [Pseudomonadales bacterium]